MSFWKGERRDEMQSVVSEVLKLHFQLLFLKLSKRTKNLFLSVHSSVELELLRERNLFDFMHPCCDKEVFM